MGTQNAAAQYRGRAEVLADNEANEQVPRKGADKEIDPKPASVDAPKAKAKPKKKVDKSGPKAKAATKKTAAKKAVKKAQKAPAKKTAKK